MAKTNLYLNFNRTTEAAFLFYQSIFGGEFVGGISRMKDAPADPAHPLLETDKDLVMHVELVLPGGVSLMGTDAPSTMGPAIKSGTNMYISLHPDTKAEADRLFAALSVNGTIEMPMQDMFWGDYFGSLIDQFGICWMINFSEATTA